MQVLWEVAHGLESASKRMHAQLGVTGPQRLVLRIMGHHSRISAGALADIMRIHPSSLTGMLQRLEQAELIRRESDPFDRRRALLELTRTRGAGLKAFLLFLTFILLGTATARAEQCNRFAVEITTTPVLYQWTSVLEKATLLLAAPPEQADTILLGDSLLAFWPKDLAAQQFGQGRVWNFGVGGSRTQHILWQLGKFAGQPSLKPREVILLIGTNNLYDNYNAGTDEEIAAGIEAVVDRIHAKLPHTPIVLLAILPRQNDYFCTRIDRINAIIQTLDTRDDVHYLDLTPDFELSHGQVKPNLYNNDHLHLEQPGYNLLRERLTPVLKPIVQ